MSWPIGGKGDDLFDFLEHLAYGDVNTPELKATREKWATIKRESRNVHRKSRKEMRKGAQEKAKGRRSNARSSSKCSQNEPSHRDPRTSLQVAISGLNRDPYFAGIRASQRINAAEVRKTDLDRSLLPWTNCHPGTVLSRGHFDFREDQNGSRLKTLPG